MRQIAILLLAGMLIGSPGLMPTQNAPPPRSPHRIQIATRLVALFSQLENLWFQALQEKKTADLDKLLDEDFQVWTPSVAGPTAREMWQQYALARTLESFTIRQMAVRSITDDNAVVSFLVNEGVQSAGKSVTYQYFVVDLWSKKADHWLCTDRYVSPVTHGRAPGAEDRKPTGKQ